MVLVVVHESVHVLSETSMCKSDELQAEPVCSTKVNFLVWLMYYRYVRCYHWEKLGEECTETHCTIFVISGKF